MNKIAILLGSFHKEESNEMLAEVKTFADKKNLEIIKITWVPGSMEKPMALKKLLMQEDVDGVVVLGIIERGETKHGMVMANVVVKSIVELQLEYMKPVGVGILGPEILPDQIQTRVRPYALSAIKALKHMLDSKNYDMLSGNT